MNYNDGLLRRIYLSKSFDIFLTTGQHIYIQTVFFKLTYCKFITRFELLDLLKIFS